MRTVAAFAVLLLVACGGDPTPADVAGVYDIYAHGDEVVGTLPEGNEVSMELREDGTILYTLIFQEDNTSHSDVDGRFSVTGLEDGCFVLEIWAKETTDYRASGTVCGEALTITEASPRVPPSHYHKRKEG